VRNENPTEPFKRAVATAVRSLSGEPELEVTYSAEPPSLRGLKARLPLPSRNLPPNEVAIVRGAGDAYALRCAYHLDTVHDQFRPQSAESAAIFEAAEQARVEAIGALAMKGVAGNLAAGLEARCAQRGLRGHSRSLRERSCATSTSATSLKVMNRRTKKAKAKTIRAGRASRTTLKLKERRAKPTFRTRRARKAKTPKPRCAPNRRRTWRMHKNPKRA
jgi:cobaltochelatase CobT